MSNLKHQRVKRELVNPIYKDRAIVLKTSEETNGAYTLGELEVSPGGGNSLHIHTAFKETFTALKGTLGLIYKDRKIYLRPGESITIPVRTPHYFFNDTQEKVVCHVRFEPGHEGFEKGISIAYGLAADGLTNKKGIPKNFAHLALIVSLTDTRPAGLIGSLLMPLFKWIAKRAKKNGTEQALLNKYYYEHESGMTAIAI
jgi:mannose-6-phosphate isomerase-like protein (cupin superfamily)